MVRGTAASAMRVLALEEGGKERVAVEDAVAARVVVVMATIPATELDTATIITRTTARSSTVSASILTSGFIRLIMAPGGSMSKDDEVGTEAMEIADGMAGTDRVAVINGSRCHLKDCHSSRCRSKCRLPTRYRFNNDRLMANASAWTTATSCDAARTTDTDSWVTTAA